MTNREIFKQAWSLARDGARRFGGSAREYFAQALRWVYAKIKESKMNTFLLSEETERKADSLWTAVEVCLLATMGILAVLLPLLAVYGATALIGCGTTGLILLASSGLLIRRAIKLESTDETC